MAKATLAQKAWYRRNRAKVAAIVEAYRANDPERWRVYRNDHTNRRRGVKKEIIRLAKDRPCADCGIWYPPCVMDFDHRDPSQKKDCVTRLKSFSVATLIDEIMKCDVVCSNCHRLRTYFRCDL